MRAAPVCAMRLPSVYLILLAKHSMSYQLHGDAPLHRPYSMLVHRHLWRHLKFSLTSRLHVVLATAAQECPSLERGRRCRGSGRDQNHIEVPLGGPRYSTWAYINTSARSLPTKADHRHLVHFVNIRLGGQWHHGVHPQDYI